MDESEIAPLSKNKYKPLTFQQLENIYRVFCTRKFLENETPNFKDFISTFDPKALSPIIHQNKSNIPFVKWSQQAPSTYKKQLIHRIHREENHVVNGAMQPPHQNPNLYRSPEYTCDPCSVLTAFPNRDWTFPGGNIPPLDHINHYSRSRPVSPKSYPGRTLSPLREIWEVPVPIFAPPENFGPNFAFGSIPLIAQAPEPRIPQFEALKGPQSPSRLVSFIPAQLLSSPPPRPPNMHGRGVLIKNLPTGITLAEICANIGGGVIERIDFQDGEERGVVGVYFAQAKAAEEYRLFVNKVGGICWGGAHRPTEIQRSFVEAIPAEKGGLERIKINVSRALDEESATRCLGISNLGCRITQERLMADINKQSKFIRPAYDVCEVLRSNPSDYQSKKQATVRLASVGTALGARLMLSRNHNYKQAIIRFLPDPCDNPLEQLGERWAADDAARSLERLRLSRVGRYRGTGGRGRSRARGIRRGGGMGLGSSSGSSSVTGPSPTQANITSPSKSIAISESPGLIIQKSSTTSSI